MPSSTTQSFSLTIYPVDWSSVVLEDKVVLCGYGLITTTDTFSVSATVTTTTGKNIGTLSLDNSTGFNSVYLGLITVPVPSNGDKVYPLTIQGTVTCSTSVTMATNPQTALGLKPNPDPPPSTIPIGYMASLFCNDAGNDNDYNDLCVNFELFSQSAD